MDADVVIVGGGPAGSSAAYFLAGKGRSVILIERLGESQFHRYHSICGAGVCHAAVKNLDLREDEIRNRVHTLRLNWPGGNKIDLKINGYIIDRPKMFDRLRNESVSKGLQVIKGSVVSVSQDEESCKVILSDGRELSCRYLVGADGAYSTVRRCIFGTTPRMMLKVEEFHSDAKATDGVLEFIVAERYNHFYQWYFPAGEGRCTGAICGYAEDEPDSVRGVRTIPLGWVPEIVKGRVLLIGDAAGMPNPMTAGGLRTAFVSGQKAAEYILKDKVYSYQKWWEKCPMSNRKFSDVQKVFSSYSDEDYAEFSKYMTHKGLWTNGIVSVLHKPRLAWLYVGCLMCLRHGW